MKQIFEYLKLPIAIVAFIISVIFVFITGNDVYALSKTGQKIECANHK